MIEQEMKANTLAEPRKRKTTALIACTCSAFNVKSGIPNCVRQAIIEALADSTGQT